MKNNINSLMTQIGDLQNQIKERDVEIAKLKVRVSNNNIFIKSLKATLFALEKEKAAEINGMDKCIGELEKEIAILEGEIEWYKWDAC